MLVALEGASRIAVALKTTDLREREGLEGMGVVSTSLICLDYLCTFRHLSSWRLRKIPYCCTSRAAIDNETNLPERIRYSRKLTPTPEKNNTANTIHLRSKLIIHAYLSSSKVVIFRVIQPFVSSSFSLLFQPSFSLLWFHSS